MALRNKRWTLFAHGLHLHADLSQPLLSPETPQVSPKAQHVTPSHHEEERETKKAETKATVVASPTTTVVNIFEKLLGRVLISV